MLAVFVGAAEEDGLWAAGLGIIMGRGAEVVVGEACGSEAMVRVFEVAGMMNFVVAGRQNEFIGIFMCFGNGGKV